MAAVVARRRPPTGSAMLTATTLVPFLYYPTLALATPRCSLRFSTLKPKLTSASPSSCRATPVKHDGSSPRRCVSTTAGDTTTTRNDLPESRLNPAPDDYAASSFTDNAEITIYAGRGGNGCVSFLREAYLPDGPPNGGDGGAGGNVYIQAAHGQTSLHKVARRRFVRAGHGQNGQGSSKGGVRGDDVIITVPVGTIVRELERQDPVADEGVRVRAYQQVMKARRRAVHEMETRMLQQRKMEKHAGQAKEKHKKTKAEDDEEDEEAAAVGLKGLRNVAGIERHGQLAQHLQQEAGEIEEDEPPEDPQRDKWLLYPGMSKTDMKAAEFPPLPRRTRLLQQPPGPIYLDLSRPTPRPILLAAGGIGGLGNSHFISRSHRRPLFATKGEAAPTLRISLELKLLADVGLVGLPNAGKSTLLRALTNSRARVGNWAFTTLVPNIGTVVLDKYEGRQRWALRRPRRSTEETKVGTVIDADGCLNEEEAGTRFTVADIPGLIEGAHLDRGLGIAFLRHVERAGVLAFVVDLSAGDAVAALKALWREVALYATMRDEEERVRAATIPDTDEAEDPFNSGTVNLMMPPQEHVMQASTTTPTMHTAGKPWFVVATKADQPDTQHNFAALKRYLASVTSGAEPHPSGVVDGAWVKDCAAIPVSAIHGQGVQRIVHWTVGLLNQE
ncbi:hypothetical protein MY8738_001022 [Beauveria namnaoensis]